MNEWMNESRAKKRRLQNLLGATNILRISTWQSNQYPECRYYSDSDSQGEIEMVQKQDTGETKASGGLQM